MRVKPKLLAAAVVVAVLPAMAQEPPVAVKVDGLPSHVRARILEKAQQGASALVRYLQRTRMIHQLRPEQVIVERQDTRPK